MLNKKITIFFIINLICFHPNIAYSQTYHTEENTNCDETSIEIKNLRKKHLTNTKKIKIFFIPSYGNEKDVYIKGKVVKDNIFHEVQKSNSEFDNFNQNMNMLIGESLKGIKINIDFNGIKSKVVTDELGMFNLKIYNAEKIITGYNQVSAKLERGQVKLIGCPAYGQVVVQDSTKSDLAVVSDIDDTIQESYITNKFKAVQTILLKNYTTQQSYSGVAELYQALDKSNDRIINGDIHYLSGSPIQISQRIESFLKYNNFPLGSIDLKRIGFSKNTDNPFQQMEYKLGKLRMLFNTYPNKKFILFGDNGEKDPEIYKEISKEYPDRVIAIYINNVKNENKNSERYKGSLLTDSALESANDLFSRGFIKHDDLEKINNSVKVNR